MRKVGGDLARLGAAAVISCAASTLAAAAVCASSSLALRPSTLQPLRLISLLLGRAGVELPGALALAADLPRATTRPLDVLLVAIPSLIAHAALTLAALALAILLLGGARRRRLSAWLWAGALAMPWWIVAEPAARATVAASSAGAAAAAVAATFVVWLLLALALRRRPVERHVVRGLATVTAAAAALGVGMSLQSAGSAPSPPPSAPNVLLVSIDSLRADHLSCYGYPRSTTPNLDRLAAEGARFTTCVSSTTWTLPAHVSLLTSLNCQRHGVVAELSRMTGNEATLAAVLARAGYATAAFVAVPFLRAEYGFIDGFDHYDDVTAARMSGAWTPWMPRGRGQRATSPELLAAARRWIGDHLETDRERPFFLFLHLFDVHYDYTPPAEFDVFDPDYRGSVTADDFKHNQAIHAGMERRDLEHVIALYDGEILAVDHHLGRLFAFLEDAGAFDDTLVIVTADHGDEFFEHGAKGHRSNLHDTTLLVPLVMRLPARIPASRTVSRQVRLIDVAPTVLGLAGVARPPEFGEPDLVPGFGARDLTPLLADERAQPPLPALAHLDRTPAALEAIRLDQEKVIVQKDAPGLAALYSLLADPAEQHDRAADDPVTLAALLRLLDAYRGTATDVAAPTVVLSEEQRRVLRSLGYLD